MMDSNHIMKIPQFDGTNFDNWKYRVGILLDEKNLRRYIEEDITKILASAAADKRDENDIRLEEKKCISVLVQTIQDSQLEYVKEKRSAKEMFDALCAVFERKSIAGYLLIKKQLLLMRYQDGDEMIEHFVKFDTKVRELKSKGAMLEELDIIAHLFITLPESYDNLVTALETMNQEKLSLEFVKTRLMDEHNKRSGRESTGRSNESGAMSAKGQRKQLKCFGCGKIGHKKSSCFAQKKGKKNSNNVNKASDEKGSTLCAVTNGQECACIKQQAVNTAQKVQRNDNTVRRSDDASQIEFVMDSGATQHMANNKQYFDNLEGTDNIEIRIAKKNQSIMSTERGNISVKTFYEGDSSTKKMENVLYVKDLQCNLMSIRSLTKKGYRVVFENDCAYVSMDGETKFVAHVDGNLYKVVLHAERNVFAGISGENHLKHFSQKLWHYRMGHLNAFDMKKMIGRRMVDGLEQVNVDIESKFCESCILGKQTRTPFPKYKNMRTSRVLELIHSDVCGPMPTTAYDGSKYYVAFTDDYSRASMVYFMERKSEVLEKFKEFQAMAEAFHGVKIATFRSDNGGEYIPKDLKQ